MELEWAPRCWLYYKIMTIGLANSCIITIVSSSLLFCFSFLLMSSFCSEFTGFCLAPHYSSGNTPVIYLIWSIKWRHKKWECARCTRFGSDVHVLAVLRERRRLLSCHLLHRNPFCTRSSVSFTHGIESKYGIQNGSYQPERLGIQWWNWN